MKLSPRVAPAVCTCLAGIMFIGSVHCPICGLPVRHAELEATEPSHAADGPERESDTRATAEPTRAVANVAAITVSPAGIESEATFGAFTISIRSAAEESSDDDPHTHSERDVRSTAQPTAAAGIASGVLPWVPMASYPDPAPRPRNVALEEPPAFLATPLRPPVPSAVYPDTQQRRGQNAGALAQGSFGFAPVTDAPAPEQSDDPHTHTEADDRSTAQPTAAANVATNAAALEYAVTWPNPVPYAETPPRLLTPVAEELPIPSALDEPG